MLSLFFIVTLESGFGIWAEVSKFKLMIVLKVKNLKKEEKEMFWYTLSLAPLPSFYDRNVSLSMCF